jgi:outer membrane protein assembly factor BamB
MTQDNQIYALDQDDGSVRWSEAASIGQASIFGVAAPAAAQATIVAGYSTGELSAYRFENGQNLWSDALSRTSISTSVSTLSDIDAHPVIDRGRVYAIGQGGRMAAYELVTGQRLWELNVGGIATPAVAGEWLFVLTDDAKLFAVARGTGRIRWVSQLPPFENMEKEKDPIRWTGPVLAGNRLIVAGTDGRLLGVDLQDGSHSALASFDDGVTLPPIVANGALYVLTDEGALIAMR